jgi:TM2 domain-containing membrane protein YozV
VICLLKVAQSIVLSLVIPGMGQFYNGDPIKGGLMLCVAVVGSFLILPWLVMCVCGQS